MGKIDSEGVIFSAQEREKGDEEAPTNIEIVDKKEELPQKPLNETLQVPKKPETSNRIHSLTETDEKIVIQRINEIVEKKFDYEDFHFWEYLVPCISKNKLRFTEVEQEFEMMSDISVIVRVVKEMQILKKLLLENYQINIFDFLVDNSPLEKENPDYNALIKSIKMIEKNYTEKKEGENFLNEKLATFLKKL